MGRSPEIGLSGPDWLAESEAERLEARIEAALVRARRTGEATLAAITVTLDGQVDPAPTVMLAAADDDWWGVFDQPANHRSSVSVLGCAVELSATGPERFESVSRQWRALVAAAVADDPEAGSGVGPIAFGGFAFADAAQPVGPWRAFGAASMVVPTVSLVRTGEVTSLTVQAHVGPDDLSDEVVARATAVVNQLVPNADLAEAASNSTHPEARIASVLSPQHYESAVQLAVDAIERGRITKAVLAREVLVHREGGHDPVPAMAVLREVFPSCFLYAVGRGRRVFLGASPELLVRREGLRAATVALAGSAPRSADPAVDDHIGERLLRSEKDRSEQAIVSDRISHELEPVSVWVTAPSEPEIAKVANIQHLATPIRAQLRSAVPCIDLVGRLHPTPAVGGEPWPEARSLIAEIEGFDRGWYAGPVGWTDASGDGEFCVALRGALLDGEEARCFAGVGVVAGSDPAGELAETELKLQAILPVVSG